MPGFNEIFIIAAIVLVIFFLIPRMKKPPIKEVRKSSPSLPPNGMIRLAIAVSIIWPLVFVAIIEPWKGDLLKFIYLGLTPVVAGWGLGWVISGFKKGA